MDSCLHLYRLEVAGEVWHFAAYSKRMAVWEYRSLTGDEEALESVRRVPPGEVVVRWDDEVYPPRREALTAAAWCWSEGRGVITCPREV